MRNLLTLLLLLLLAAPALAQNQGELNRQAEDDYRAADAALNAVYRKLTPKLAPAVRENLVTAQLAWIKYRDAAAKARASEFEGGSMRPMIFFGSMAATTRARTRELQEWLDEFADR